MRSSIKVHHRHFFAIVLSCLATIVNAQDETNRCDQGQCLGPGLIPTSEVPLELSPCWGIGPETDFPFMCAEGYDVHSLSPVQLGAEQFFFYSCCPRKKDIDGGEKDTEASTLECTETACSSPDGEGGVDCWVDLGGGEGMPCDGDIFKYPHLTGALFAFQFSHYLCCNEPEYIAEDEPDKDGDSSNADPSPPQEGDDDNGKETSFECTRDACSSPDLQGGVDCWVDLENDEEMTCDSDFYKYPHTTGIKSASTFSNYVCCNRPDANTTDTFQPEPESKCTTQVCSSPDGNRGTDCIADGPFEPMTCDSNEYRYPFKTDVKKKNDDTLFWHDLSEYVCCNFNTGTPPLSQNLVVAEGLRVAIATLALLCSLLLFLAIMRSKSARVQAYNLYLVGLTVPDMMLNAMLIAGGSIALSGNRAIKCEVASFSLFFYAVGNVWLNTCIAYQCYKLMKDSKIRRKADPPPVRRVKLQCAFIFVSAVVLGIVLGLLACGYAFDVSEGSNTQIFFGVVNGLLLLLPITYFFYVCFRIWKDKLLPRSGRTRVLALYFLRIIAVFIICWLPFFFVMYLGLLHEGSGVLSYIVWYLTSLQGIISPLLTLFKPDIRKAVAELLHIPNVSGEDPRWNSTRSFLKRSSSSFLNRSRSFMKRRFTKDSSRLDSDVEGHGKNSLKVDEGIAVAGGDGNPLPDSKSTRVQWDLQDGGREDSASVVEDIPPSQGEDTTEETEDASDSKDALTVNEAAASGGNEDAEIPSEP